jgi:hypothetical protein
MTCAKRAPTSKGWSRGIQVETHGDAMFSPAANAGLNLMSRAVDPQIKIVRVRRTLLDNFITDRKHENARVVSHCPAGHQRCIEKHKKAGTNLILSVMDLLAFLESKTS